MCLAPPKAMSNTPPCKIAAAVHGEYNAARRKKNGLYDPKMSIAMGSTAPKNVPRRNAIAE